MTKLAVNGIGLATGRHGGARRAQRLGERGRKEHARRQHGRALQGRGAERLRRREDVPAASSRSAADRRR